MTGYISSTWSQRSCKSQKSNNSIAEFLRVSLYPFFSSYSEKRGVLSDKYDATSRLVYICKESLAILYTCNKCASVKDSNHNNIFMK